MLRETKSLKFGIDVIVGTPVTAASFPNVNDMPKIYSVPPSIIYGTNPIDTKSKYERLDSVKAHNINTNYGTNLLNRTYFKNDTFKKDHKFTSTQTKKPQFDINTSYDNTKFNYIAKG
jgi:hypothetical protein